MSEVILKVEYLQNGFAEISVDDNLVGRVEDPEQNLGGIMRRLVDKLEIDNTKVVILAK